MKAEAKRGRPPTLTEQQRNAQIIAAAEAIFVEVGFGAATMEQIARVAGMSKRTLYSHYKDKQSLLAAVTIAADDFPWEDNSVIEELHPVDELRERLLKALNFALSQRQLDLTRLLISAANRHPGLAENFHERVMAKCKVYLQSAVQHALDHGFRSNKVDNDTVTSCLLGAAWGEAHLLSLMGKPAPSTDSIREKVECALVICGFDTTKASA